MPLTSEQSVEELKQKLEELENKRENKWHFDRRIPVSMILAIVVQAVAFISWFSWWGAGIQTRLENLEKASDSSFSPRLAVVEAKIDNAVANFDRNKALLEMIDAKIDNIRDK